MSFLCLIPAIIFPGFTTLGDCNNFTIASGYAHRCGKSPGLWIWMSCSGKSTTFIEINAHPEINAHQKNSDFSKGEYTKPMGFDGWFFKGGSTQNRWALMDDFSKGGVHKTDGLWWVIFQRGEVHKTEENRGKRPMTTYCFTQRSNGCSLGSLLFLLSR